MAKTLDPLKEPSRFLTVAYVIALSLIALLTYGSHHVMDRALMAQKDKADVVYTAGRQRMLAQKIALYASSFEHDGSTDRDRDTLQKSILNFQMGNHFLTHINGDQERPMSAEMHDVYYKPPYDLDKQVASFVDAAKKFTAWQPTGNPADRDSALRTVSALAEGILTDGLDRVDNLYQEEIEAELESLSHTQMMMTIYVMLILVLEAIFIFNPLVRHVKSYSKMILKMALKDSLTGLNNRRAFMERGAVELNRVDRHGFPLCVVMADIDKFKLINDTHGHDVGDKVIQHFANVFRKALRAEDVVGRIGGEEFALILPHTLGPKGFQTVDRIRKMVEKTPCLYTKGAEKATLNYTASFGMVEITEAQKGASITELLKFADTALYEAKKGGRNRVIMGKADPFVAPHPDETAPSAAQAG